MTPETRHAFAKENKLAYEEEQKLEETVGPV